MLRKGHDKIQDYDDIFDVEKILGKRTVDGKVRQSSYFSLHFYVIHSFIFKFFLYLVISIDFNKSFELLFSDLDSIFGEVVGLSIH